MSNSRFQGIHHVQKGSGVTASNTSQSTRELEARTNELHGQLDAIAAGMVLQWELRAISTDVKEGTAVYWNATTVRFEPAMAGAAHDPATGLYVATPASDVLGVCLHKEDSVTGTIIFGGFAEMTPQQVINLFGEGATPGRYFLSSTLPGMLVKQSPAITIAVAYLLGPTTACDVNSWVYILPQQRNFLEDHVHYSIELAAVPAGAHVAPELGDSHEILAPFLAIPGWLPANNAVFKGLAPAGAVFGYNIAADQSVLSVWPPMPVSSAAIEIMRPESRDLPEVVGFVRVPDNYVRIDLNGIWWMTDCYNQVPWDTYYNSDGSGASSSAAAGDCPINPPVRLTLTFLRMLAITNKTVVTSLQPAIGAPLEFLDANGAVAKTGDLWAKLDFSLLVADEEAYGGEVLKGVTDDSSQFTTGWVTEGLVAGSASVTLSSSHSRPLDPALPISDANPELHQGVVSVSVISDSDARELQTQLTKLSDTLEREHKGVLYIGFPPNRTCSAKFSITIPTTGLPLGGLQLHLRTLVFGRTTGPLPDMTMSYYKITRPVDGTPTPIIPSQTAIGYDINTPSDDIDGTGADLAVDTVIEVESDPFDIEAGDTIFITIERNIGATPAFNADVGLIRITGILT